MRRNKIGLSIAFFCLLMTGWVFPSHSEYQIAPAVRVVTPPIGGGDAVVTVVNYGLPLHILETDQNADPSACELIEVKLIKYLYAVPTTTVPITEPIGDGEEAAILRIPIKQVSSVRIANVPGVLMKIGLQFDRPLCNVDISAIGVDESSNPTGDVFVHYSAIQGSGFRTLSEGQIVK